MRARAPATAACADFDLRLGALARASARRAAARRHCGPWRPPHRPWLRATARGLTAAQSLVALKVLLGADGRGAACWPDRHSPAPDWPAPPRRRRSPARGPSAPAAAPPAPAAAQGRYWAGSISTSGWPRWTSWLSSTRHADHLAGDLGRDIHDVRLEERVVRGLDAALVPPPEALENDQHDESDRAADDARRAGGTRAARLVAAAAGAVCRIVRRSRAAAALAHVIPRPAGASAARGLSGRAVRRCGSEEGSTLGLQSHPTTVRNGTLAPQRRFPSTLDDPPASPRRFEKRPHIRASDGSAGAGDAADYLRPCASAIAQRENGGRRRVESHTAGAA